MMCDYTTQISISIASEINSNPNRNGITWKIQELHRMIAKVAPFQDFPQTVGKWIEWRLFLYQSSNVLLTTLLEYVFEMTSMPSENTILGKYVVASLIENSSPTTYQLYNSVTNNKWWPVLFGKQIRMENNERHRQMRQLVRMILALRMMREKQAKPNKHENPAKHIKSREKCKGKKCGRKKKKNIEIITFCTGSQVAWHFGTLKAPGFLRHFEPSGWEFHRRLERWEGLKGKKEKHFGVHFGGKKRKKCSFRTIPKKK